MLILFCDVCRGAYQIADGKQDQFYADHAHNDDDEAEE